MVTLLNPPTPRDPPVTPSDALVSEHEVGSVLWIFVLDWKYKCVSHVFSLIYCLFLLLLTQRRVDAEIQQLLLDIRRIGPTYPPPEPNVLFGELFDDDSVQQYYEALVGTLKCAKKREF